MEEEIDVFDPDGTTISGFLTRPVKKGKSLGFRRKRFYKLDGAVLSKHANKGSPTSLAINVQGAEIKEIGKLMFAIQLNRTETFTSHDYEKEVHVLSARTERECVAWVWALKAAAQRRLKQYYEVGRVIGEGGFAAVRIGRCLKTKELRAIKTLQKDDTYAKLQGREIAIIKSTDHPNIVKTYDVFETKTKIHIVMEYMAGGMLYDTIEDGIRFTEADIVQVMKEILDGILYLHGKGIVHRDLKPENILCTSKTAPLHVKISDFGLSCITNVADLKENRVLMSTMIGTPEFIAPEIARQERYTEKVDMWALGMLCYNVIAGTLPIDETKDLIPQIKDGVKLTFSERVWKSYRPEALSFLRALLCTEPEKRLSPLGCMVHPWLERNWERTSTKIGTHGRVSHRISRMMLPRTVNRHRQNSNKTQTLTSQTNAGSQALAVRKGWKTAFLVVSAANRLKWLVTPRQPDKMEAMDKLDSLTLEEDEGEFDSDSDDSTMGSAKLAFYMKAARGSPGQEKRPSLSSLKNKKGQGVSKVKGASNDGDPKLVAVAALHGSGSSGSGSSQAITKKQNWRDRGKLNDTRDGFNGAKKSRWSKDRAEVSSGLSPLRKVSRKITTAADNAGILGPLRKISKKLSSVAGRSKGQRTDDGDLELSLTELGVTVVDEGDLLMLEEGELYGPTGSGSRGSTESQAERSLADVAATSPVTPRVGRASKVEDV